MKITLNDKDKTELKIDPKVVSTARKLEEKFLNSVKAMSAKAERPDLYYGALVILNSDTSDILRSIEPAKLKATLEMFNDLKNDDNPLGDLLGDNELL